MENDQDNCSVDSISSIQLDDLDIEIDQSNIEITQEPDIEPNQEDIQACARNLYLNVTYDKRRVVDVLEHLINSIRFHPFPSSYLDILGKKGQVLEKSEYKGEKSQWEKKSQVKSEKKFKCNSSFLDEDNSDVVFQRSSREAKFRAIKGQNQQNLRKVSSWSFEGKNQDFRMICNKVAPRCRNKEEDTKFYQKRLIAKSFCQRQWGLSGIKAEYIDSRSIIEKTIINQIPGVPPATLEKPRYKTIMVAFISQVYRKFQEFIMDKIDKRIRAIIGSQIKQLYPILLNAQINFPQIEYDVFRRFVKYTYDLGSVSIAQIPAKRLYNSIQLHLRDKITEQTICQLNHIHYCQKNGINIEKNLLKRYKQCVYPQHCRSERENDILVQFIQIIDDHIQSDSVAILGIYICEANFRQPLQGLYIPGLLLLNLKKIVRKAAIQQIPPNEFRVPTRLTESGMSSENRLPTKKNIEPTIYKANCVNRFNYFFIIASYVLFQRISESILSSAAKEIQNRATKQRAPLLKYQQMFAL